MAQYQTTAIAFGDLKNAALYFDHIVPVFLAVEYVKHLKGDDWQPHVKAPMECLPPDLSRRPGFLERWAEVNEASYYLLVKMAAKQFGFSPNMPLEKYENIENTAISAYFAFIDEFGLRDYPVACLAEEPASTAWMDDNENDSNAPSPIVSIANIGLIDVSKASWQQVTEFRKDSEARNRLRRLRLFAYENYSKCSRAQIEDDLLVRVYDYEKTAKQWGLDTVQGAFNIVLNSKLTASVVAGSFLSALFGQPTTALVSASVGVAIEIAHVGIEISRQRLAFQNLVRENPVSFISYSRKTLSAKP